MTMDKFSELKAAAMAATPGPWVVTDKNNVEAPNQKRFRPVAYIFGNRAEHKRAADAAFIAAANPAVVLAILAELEAKDKRIAELEEEFAFIMGQNDGMEKELRDKDARIEHLEAKLATPVRLTEERTLWAGEDDYDTGHVKGWNANRIEQAALLKKQGFTVEGDS
ncbi:ead/Ea22-like family protein [Serratia marcescens]|nr:ead/Ea22-like family protein [Serratia marcescens]